MKVLQVIAGREKGGAESFFSRLAIAFARAGIQQHLITRDIPIWNEMFAQAQIPVTHSRFTPALSWFVRRMVKKKITEFKPDIILTWMNRATKVTPKGQAVKIARLGGYYNLKYYRHSDFLIGNTEDIVTYLENQGWPKDKCRHLPNFVNEPAQETSAEDRARWNTPQDAPLIFALGRLHTNKAFDILISSLKNVPGAYLWLAGAGPLENELKAQVQNLGLGDRVRFLGWQYDATPFFKAADIFVCPSRHEPFGNVVAEAFAHQMPVISTASQGPKAMIQDGHNALMTAIDNVEELTHAINRLIHDTDLREKVAVNGFQTYKKNYSEDVVVNNYIQLFKDLIL